MKEYKYTINGNKYEVAVGDVNDSLVQVVVNGEQYSVELEKKPVEQKKKPVVRPVAAAPKATEPAKDGAKANMTGALRAPLPGIVTEIKVALGDSVQKGDTVVVLEAMKMENNLEAEKSGKVTAILVNAGESVMEDTPLVVIE